jgi:hypothetical protein
MWKKLFGIHKTAWRCLAGGAGYAGHSPPPAKTDKTADNKNKITF